MNCSVEMDRKFVSSARTATPLHWLSFTFNSIHYFRPLTRSSVLPLKAFSANSGYKSCIRIYRMFLIFSDCHIIHPPLLLRAKP